MKHSSRPLVNSPTNAPETLVDLLRSRAEKYHDRLAYRFTQDGETEPDSITYGELDRRARAIGAWLETAGAGGERALLLYPPGLDFIAAFFGCLYAGVTAVPAYPPRLNRPVPRIQSIVADSKAAFALTTSAILTSIEQRFEHAPDLQVLQWKNTTELEDGLESAWRQPIVSSETLAFLQYTSGSTSKPKGVMLTHGNLLHNLRAIKTGFRIDSDDSGVFWLPSYHDMGLIGGILEPMYIAGPSTLMSPVSFLQRPIRWLETITRFRGTVTGAPNFAYDLCVDKITPEQLKELDLSSLYLAFCGAEPIRPETLDRFARTFEACGFRRSAFYACYGLAESTLLVAGGDGPAAPRVSGFDRKSLERDRAVPGEEGAQRMVSCGSAVVDQDIVIVDPKLRRAVEQETVGEIWVSGPSVARGYWGLAEESRHTFQAQLAETGNRQYLRTGDLGFMHEGELYVTGRLKDLIIIHGSNHYPQDIELTVESSHPALQAGGGAAFSINEGETERLVIVYELARKYRRADINDVAAAIRQAVAETHDLQIFAIVLIKPMSIPKTSSGKIQRQACRRAFMEQQLEVVAEWRANQRIDPPVTPIEAGGHSQAPRDWKGAETIRAWLVDRIAALQRISPQEVDPRQPFTYYGIGSVQAVGLSGELETFLNRTLAPTLAWDYPTIESLADYLASDSPPAATAVAVQASREAPRPINEPVAIVGMSCRFPGAPNAEAFWELLRNGVDAIREVPPERWDVDSLYTPDPATPGKVSSRWGGFIEHADSFDATFFGISPREASRMDPQQRILLEVAWEALENASIPPDSLAGSRTGVFVGISSYDYSQLQFGNPQAIDAYAGTGNAHSIAANRLSYLLDLRGPSMAIDTACSSSLVAAHLASQSLRNGESDLALVGGVNLILTPELTITFSQARMLSPDGRCKTFDARADGYVRGEGCGVVVLKRLSDALRDGDEILALLRGSAVNQDGRTNGLTAPNGLAQQAVIREAMANAALVPEQVSYVEAHGTGTPLGDPIEMASLRAVLNGDSANRVLVGSVKTNIGHLEAAAGIAGLIKTILALKHEALPPHLHLKEINPYLSLEDSRLEIGTYLRPWKRRDTPRVAGVSSFGFGGTNAHVILSDGPIVPASPEELERPRHMITLSARTQTSLLELARRTRTQLERPEDALADIAFTANTGRSHFEHRLAIPAESRQELKTALDAFLSGSESPGHIIGHSQPGSRPKVAFLFSGQGAQYIGMGRRLHESQPVFRAALDQCAEILNPSLDHSLLDVLFGQEYDLINETRYTQPALFSLEYALAEMWRSWGIEPKAVMGHSVGEYVAACIAGVFSLEDGLRLITERARLMGSLPDDGAMAVVFADARQVGEVLEPYARSVSIAAANGSENTVISGVRTDIREIVSDLARQGVKSKSLTVSHAFHSPLMDPILYEFEAFASRMNFNVPRLPLISNVTGEALHADQRLDAAYWRRHIREAVRFSEGMKALAAMGIHTFIEIGPAPVLLNMGQACLPESGRAWLPSLRKEQDDWLSVLDSLGRLYVLGANVDWAGFDKGYGRRKVTLPNYPFERQRFWFSTPNRGGVVQGRQESVSEYNDAKHPVLGHRLRAALPIYETQVQLSNGSLRKKIEELARAAAVETFGEGNHQLGEIDLHKNSNGHEGALNLQTVLSSPLNDRVDLKFFVQPPNTGHDWSLLASGTLQKRSAPPGNGSGPAVDHKVPSTPSTTNSTSPTEHEDDLQNFLRSQVARVLGMNANSLRMDQPLDTMGLDSLMAMELKNVLEAKLGTSLSVASFLQGPTISGLTAEALARSASDTTATISPFLRSEGQSDQSPLSHGQQALWFLHQLLPEDVSFNVAGAVRLTGQLDIRALEAAFRQVTARHESLRTTFHVVNGEPVQRIHPAMEISFSVEDASALSEAELRKRLAYEAHRAFDLEKGPLLRAFLFTENGKSEHVLLLAIDHIVTDFWSMNILARELITTYQANRAGREAEFVPLQARYADYVRWHEDMLAGPDGEKLKEYWQKKLGANLPLLDLPTDRRRPSVQTYRGDSAHLLMDHDLYEGIKVIAQKQGATPFMALLAAFQVLLYRYSGQTEFLVGSVTAGREHAELAGLIGYFINPIVLRAELGGDPTFEEVLQRTRRTSLEAFDHQNYPPALLAKNLGLQRDPSRPPLFETMFILQKAQDAEVRALGPFALGMDGARMELDDLVLESIALGGEPAQFDLTMMMAETQGGLGAALQYNADLFDQETIERMLAHFQALLEGIVRDPGLPVSDYALMGEAERRRLVVDWNETKEDYRSDLCIHEIIEGQALSTPDAIAVQSEGAALTYQELERRTDELAARLISQGLKPGSLVGLFVSRSIDMLVGLLGVLKAGAAYLPLDPSFPSERLAFMLEDSGASIMLTQKSLTAELPESALKALCIDEPEFPDLIGFAARSRRKATPDDLAYVIYTSGSTGKPKGVQIHHRAVVNFLSSMRKRLGFSSHDALLAVTTLSFDIAVLELLTPLTVGARVVIADSETVSDGALLARALADSDATIMQATPAGWRSMLEAGWEGKDDLRILCGGEALTTDLAEALLNCGAELWNLYGPTETTIWSTAYRVTPPLEQRPNVPIGRPIANTQVYILDARMQPVPVGVTGDLYIGGDGVSRGYLNRPGLTAERFTANPFIQDATIYRTGDLARYLPDGNIEFLGRSDQQVKVRGFRIETGEVEVALTQHPDVLQAMVVAWRALSSDAALVAYVVPAPGAAAHPAQLRDFLRSRLPEYMVPSLFVTLQSLPLTPNGKVDRKALPAPSTGRPDTRAPYVAPRTELERELAEICAQVLGLEGEGAGRVGVHDNFFDLGGHSLLGTRLIFLLREKYGLEPAALPLRALFEQPTVAHLATRIETALSGGELEMPTASRGDFIRRGQLSLDELNAEAVLDPDVTSGGLAYEHIDEPSNILLTGASGFVGAFLLHELVQRTSATLHCIVRAADPEKAAARIRRNLEAYALWDDSFEGRIEPLIGDLAEPRLGLGMEAFHGLASTIDVIYHNGAMVNFVYPYQAHKASNVLGTQEVLRLASLERLKPVHLVSTLSILYSGGRNDGRVFREDQDLDQVGTPFGGYAQSKWVAEKLVMEAGRRGIPYAIYRPGLVSGHSNTGAWNTDNLISSMTRACIMLGSLPDLDVLVNIVPVDFVSAAIVQLSKQPENLGQVYHIDNPQPLHFSRLVDWLSARGLAARRLSFDDWRTELFRRIAHMPSDGWEPYLPLIEEVDEEQVFMPNFDLSNTLTRLEGSGIQCSPVDEHLLSTYLEYFIPRGFLEKPAA